jgi:hypothetical protein
MREGRIKVLFREDLYPINKDIPFEVIDIYHFKPTGNDPPFFAQDVILFIDGDSRQKVLKNRYGYQGVILPQDPKIIRGLQLFEEFVKLFGMK